MLLLIEQYLFYFFLFAIPFQTRKILWYSGWRFNEWQSISIYAKDILLVVLLFFWAFNLKKFKLARSDYFLIIFWIVSGVSILNSSDYILSFFQWMKLAELIVFYFYLSRYAFSKFGLINSLFAV